MAWDFPKVYYAGILLKCVILIILTNNSPSRRSLKPPCIWNHASFRKQEFLRTLWNGTSKKAPIVFVMDSVCTLVNGSPCAACWRGALISIWNGEGARPPVLQRITSHSCTTPGVSAAPSPHNTPHMTQQLCPLPIYAWIPLYPKCAFFLKRLSQNLSLIPLRTLHFHQNYFNLTETEKKQ